MPGTAAGIRKANEALARRRAERRDRARVVREAGMTFSECFDTVFATTEMFDNPTWLPWRTVGKAIFAEALDADELALFQAFTGRTVAPTLPAREVWLLVGRRAGKDKFAAACVVYLAFYKTWPLKVGDNGRVILLAVDMEQAKECFGYVTSLVDVVPELKALEKSRSDRQGMYRLTLDNRIEVIVKPADKRRVRGRTVVAVVASEVAHWWDSDQHANPAVEVFRALRPSMFGMPGALMIAVSSPYGARGLAYETYRAHWGKDGDRVLVWNAPTVVMRPSTAPDDLDFLEAELARDPVNYASEFEARFRDDLVSYISREQIDALVVPGRSVLPPEPGVTYYAFFDPSGGKGQDSASLAIAAAVHGKAVLCRVDEWRPRFESTDVAPEVVAILRSYRITRLTGDAFSGDTWPSLLRKEGLEVYEVEKRSVTDLYRALIPLLTPKLVELLDPSTGETQTRMVNQLVSLDRSTTLRAGKEHITHPLGAHDDLCNAMAGALLLAFAKASRGEPPSEGMVSSYTKDFTNPRGSGEVIDNLGTRFLGGDTFRARNGELFRDPRGL
jgi:hypothetical protein